MTDWKPGDAAVAHYKGRDVRGFIDHDGRFYTTDQSLRGVSSFTSSLLPQNLRPLVVIDPESAEQMERLGKLWMAAQRADLDNEEPMSIAALRMRAAIREFADPKPPKPDEPTGLGAVVEDAEGDLWVRCDAEDHGSWRRANDDALWRDYLSIDAVRVLSEGIDA